MNIKETVTDVDLYVGKDTSDTYFWLVPANTVFDCIDNVPDLEQLNDVAFLTMSSMLDMINVMENGLYHVNAVEEFFL